MVKAIGTAPNQIPTNANLGTAAYQDATAFLGASAKAADSELLDGLDSTQFLRSDINDSTSGNLTLFNTSPAILFDETDTSTRSRIIAEGGVLIVQAGGAGAGATFSSGDFKISGYSNADIGAFTVRHSGADQTIWHSGNDGASSGLDADLLDGQHASTFSTVTGTETLTNKTLTAPTITSPAITAPTITGTVIEDVYTLTGTTPALEPANGSIQTWTLTANSTPTDSLAAGEGITLMIDDGTAYTITWPTITWINNAAAAPTLAATGYTVVALWKVSTTLYGALVGDGT